MQGTAARSDALVRRMERLDRKLGSITESFHAAADRFNEDASMEPLLVDVWDVALDRGDAIAELITIHEDSNALWRDRERALTNALRVCVVP